MITKTSRQLVLIHIFSCSRVVEISDITDIIKISTKTVKRDLKDLQDAGILNVKFDRKEKGYVNNASPFMFSLPIFSDNRARNKHIEKLIRLAAIMEGLRYHREIPFDDDQETCSRWYKKRFPDLSTRTMQRDFKELNKIGYEIKYDRFEKYYIVDFPEGLEDIESRIEEHGLRNE
jgi:predicted DNA-binding transcriptional regulator YafY